jgi:hypothetical protein
MVPADLAIAQTYGPRGPSRQRSLSQPPTGATGTRLEQRTVMLTNEASLMELPNKAWPPIMVSLTATIPPAKEEVSMTLLCHRL